MKISNVVSRKLFAIHVHEVACGVTEKRIEIISIKSDKTRIISKIHTKGMKFILKIIWDIFQEALTYFHARERSADAPLCLSNILSMDNLVLKRADLIIGTYWGMFE